MSASDWQELRVAVALTGGVSLAVWIGGVATELQHMARGDGPYGALAQLTRTRTSVDLIGGSSAGGINGACLALALSHGTDMAVLRDLWVEQGSLELLLREEDDVNAVSLLRGDDYFLPHIRSALENLCGVATEPTQNPVELIITGTLLRGRRQECVDDFGSVFTDVAHKAQFRFRRGPEHPVDDFARSDIAARLALAARCTSSFPGAFEASWCPIGDSSDADRPDMSEHADFARSAWVIDGGVLLNKPLAPVLATLSALPSEAGERRVVMFVQPAPDDGRTAEDAGDQVVPAFGAVLGSGMLGIPHAESLSADLTVLEQHNVRVDRQHRRRELLLRADTAWTRRAAEQVLESYLRDRTQTALAAVADHLPATACRSLETIEGILRRRRETEGQEPPRQLPATHQELARWSWTTSEVAEAERVAADVLQRISQQCPSTVEDRQAVSAAQQSLGAVRARLHLLQRREARARLDYARALLRGETDAAYDISAPAAAACGQLHEELAATLVDVLAKASTVTLPEPPSTQTDVPIDLRSADRTAVRCWLLQLAVVMKEEHPHQPSMITPWELLHVSAEAPNAFDTRRHPGDKLAGLQLQHFGAFYKSSWRANDWMWGRLDAAARLVQLQLSPPRLRELAIADPGLVDALVNAIGDLCDAADLEPSRRPDPQALRGELAILPEQDQPLPATLPECTAAMLAVVHSGILRDELSYVASRVMADDHDGHTPQPGGARLVEACRELGHAGAGEALAEAFASCRLGEERLSIDARSPVYRRLVERVTGLAVRLGHPESHQHPGLRARELRLWSSSPLARAVRYSTIQSRTLLAVVTVLVVSGDALVLATLAPRAGLVVGATLGCAVLGVAVALAGLRVGRGRQFVIATIGLSVGGRIAFGVAHTGPLAWRLWVSAIVALALAGAAHIRLRPRLRRRLVQALRDELEPEPPDRRSGRSKTISGM